MIKQKRADNPSNFLAYIYKAGILWRNKLKPGMAQVQGQIENANERLRASLPEGADLKDGLAIAVGGVRATAEVLRNGASGAIARGQAMRSKWEEVLAGLPVDVAPMLQKLIELELLAKGKAELAVTQLAPLVAARQHFVSSLKPKALADVEADRSSEMELMQTLLTEAEEAIKSLPTTAGEMQKLHMHFIGAMGELGDLADEHAEKLELFLQKLGAKSFLAAMDPSETSELKTEDEYADALKLYLEKLSSEISALKLEMDTMSAKIRTQPSLALAVDLSNLGSRIAALSARHAKNIAFTEKQLRRLQAAESQLFASQSSAAKRGIDKHPELFALGQQAFKALRSTPRDLEAAEAKTAAYTTLLFELSEKGESNMD